MTKKNHHVVLLLDRSGSMASYINTTIKGVNEVLSTAKNVQKETNASVKITMVGFECDSEVMEGFDAVPVQKLNPVTSKEVYGRGGTQMYDGIQYTLKHLAQTVKDGDTVFVGIFTDGETGGDTHSAAHIKKLVEASGSTFAFLTPKSYRNHGQHSGSLIGIPASNVMEYEVSHGGMRSAFYRLSRGLRNYLDRVISYSEGDLFRIDGFFDGVDPENAVMKVNGLEVQMNMPESLRSDDETQTDELPPYAPVIAYVVDEYPACPTHWMNGSSKAASYFVPVKTGHGMWLDFNKLQQDEHEIAVVISVQGVNPITGQKTESLRLEKYEKNCPVHKTEFGQENFCKECGFKWPTQNYISTNASPNGQFWLDGFRAADGKVRQYIFTEEQARGVAKAVIGDDRVFAIGIAFFKSKEKKPRNNHYMRGMHLADSLGTKCMDFDPSPQLRYGSMGQSASVTRGLTNLRSATKGGLESRLSATFSLNKGAAPISHGGGGACAASLPDVVDGRIDQTLYQLAPTANNDMFGGTIADSAEVSCFATMDAALATAPVQTKSYEVGAGAKIDQQVHADTNSMEYWQEEPFACLYINYADQDSVEKILKAGKRKEVTEGFLAGVPVGN